MKKKLKCYLCEGNCKGLVRSKLKICENATSCWKSSIREKNGTINFARGCAFIPQDYEAYSCNSEVQFGNSDRIVDCCFHDYCNYGRFPSFTRRNSDNLSPIPVSDIIRALQSPYPFVLLIMILLPMILCFRYFMRTWGTEQIETYSGSKYSGDHVGVDGLYYGHGVGDGDFGGAGGDFGGGDCGGDGGG